jgi:hypothetical protein
MLAVLESQHTVLIALITHASLKGGLMIAFLLWCILLVLCWPLALLALVLYPFVWLILLPFRLIGIAVGGVFDLLKVIITLPARILKKVR